MRVVKTRQGSQGIRFVICGLTYLILKCLAKETNYYKVIRYDKKYLFTLSENLVTYIKIT